MAIESHSKYEDRLITLISSNPRVMSLLRAVRTLDLDSWCIAAGTVRNLVWDHLHAHDTPTLPSDIDVLIYDQARTDPAYETSLEQTLSALVADVRWEVVNQATIHEYTGDAVPYRSIAEAMSRWADLVTAVGAWLDHKDRIRVVSPTGLSDLFELQVRPNLVTPTAETVYRERIATKGWRDTWPKLTIHGAS